jgi:hypothetical protein
MNDVVPVNYCRIVRNKQTKQKTKKQKTVDRKLQHFNNLRRIDSGTTIIIVSVVHDVHALPLLRDIDARFIRATHAIGVFVARVVCVVLFVKIDEREFEFE